MLLSLAMIVRDEEEMLPGCLASVKDIVDEMIVVDTGSTDNTPAIARSFGAQLIDAEWRDDFSAARNVGLAAARGRWILVMDADERFVGSKKALQRVLRKPGVIAFDVAIHNEIDGREDRHSSVRLFRRLPGVRFERRLHEQVIPSLMRVRPDGRFEQAPFHLRHLGYEKSEVERKGKRARNIALATSEAAAHPDDAFSLYNLALEHMAAGDIDEGLAGLRRARALVPVPHPVHGRFFKMEADIMRQRGELEAALGLAHGYLALWPDYTDLHFVRGLILEQKGDLEAAEAAFRTCLRLGTAATPPFNGVDPRLGGVDAELALARVLRREGNPNEALPLLRSVARGMPGDMAVVSMLVACAIANGDDPARLTLEQPPDPAEIGAVLFRMGRYRDAINALEEAERVKRDLPVDHFLVKALAHLRAGDAPGAERQVRLAAPRLSLSTRRYVADLVAWHTGKRSTAELVFAYPEDHPIWNDVPLERTP